MVMRVGVSSPHLISRKGLCALLGALPQVSVVLDVPSPLDDIERIEKADPAVLLVDAPSPADLELVAHATRLLPRARVLLLTDQVDQEFELRAVKAGARGCFSKADAPELLAKALGVVAGGDLWITHRTGSRIIGEFVRSRDKKSSKNRSRDLSRREWEILSLVAQGYRNKQIGQRLFVCESTIKSHLYAMYKKLEITSRLEAVLYYYHHLNRQTAPAGSAAPASLSENTTPPPAAGKAHAAIR